MIMSREYLPKEKAIYQAVIDLFEEGADINNLTVAGITGRAGIGKGTAYEYFSGKEEMIAKAFFYNGEVFCKQLYEGMRKEKELHDKIDFVLLTMEQQVSRANCIFRLLHMLSDNSPISKWIKDLIKQKTSSGEIPASDVIRRVLNDELQGRKDLSEEKMTYLILAIYSKIFCYALLLKEERYKQAENREALRELVNRGICREVEEIFSLSDQF